MLVWVLLGYLGQAATSQPVAVPSDENKVFVTIESNATDLTLIRHAGSAVGTVMTSNGARTVVLNTYQPECAAPCEKYVLRPGDRFFVQGSGMTPSDFFSLLGQGNSLRLKVQGGSAWVRFLGTMLISIGTLGLSLGGTFVLVDFLVKERDAGVGNPYLGSSGAENTFRNVGWGSLIGGAAATLCGIPLMSFSDTRVEFLPGILPRSKGSAAGEL